MPIFDKDTMEKAGRSDWLAGEDFEGEGLVLQVKSVEKVKSQYGAKADSGMVEREILQEGETFRYTFADKNGTEKQFDSTSMPFMIGLNNAEFNFGDWVHIKRTGKLRDTRYTAEKVDAPEVSPEKNVDYPGIEDVDPKDIPF
jgi:hypothetical protein